MPDANRYINKKLEILPLPDSFAPPSQCTWVFKAGCFAVTKQCNAFISWFL